MSIKKSALGFVIIITLLITFWGIKSSITQSIPPPQSDPVSKTDKPTIVSTKPDPLEGAVVPATATIEITFNRQLENAHETKIRFDPEIPYKIVLSEDGKTARITADEPFELGLTYTLFIIGETKFKGLGQWNEEKIFHFQTIKYRGV